MLFVASWNKHRYKWRLASRHMQIIDWEQGLLARKAVKRENNTREPTKDKKPDKPGQYRQEV